VPEDLSYLEFKSIYKQAYAMGLKGCTTFRPNPKIGSALTMGAELEALTHCCGIDKEVD
jgi:ribonucleoside-diphosphate reductase alpha chain